MSKAKRLIFNKPFFNQNKVVESDATILYLDSLSKVSNESIQELFERSVFTDELMLKDHSEFEGTQLQHNCGILEILLSGNYFNDLLTTISSLADQSGIILCSINYTQRARHNELIRLGFSPAGEWTANPNSGNKIRLYSLDISNRINRHLKRLRSKK